MSAIIGTDESGKGDYFGPLVVAGVCLEAKSAVILAEAGVRDSKLISDARAHLLATTIRENASCEVVAIGPARYNQMYRRIGNLNRLLAWAHARVIENLLDKTICQEVISDQFGDEHFLQEALMVRGKQIKLTQRPRAESELSVAAASILARAEFLRRLSNLSKSHGIELPKGAGPQTIEAGIAFVSRHGPELLEAVAKLHFKTTALVLGRKPGGK